MSSTSTEHLRESAVNAVQKGCDEIAVLGGDGAFHHVAEAVFGYDVTLGFFPAGTGNDIASGLGLPCDPLAASQIYLECEPRTMDAVRIRFDDGRTAVCFGSGGLGLDAEAARLANGAFRMLPGKTRYIAGALWAYPRFPLVKLEAEIDGKRRTGEVLLAAIANVPNYGSGVRIAPAAKPNDGRLDVTLVGKIDWMRVVPAIQAMLITGNLRPGEIERFRAQRAAFRTDRPVWFQGDGEILGTTPLEVEILPNAIRVRAPISAY